jgi:preprotein translocase subunit SecA
VLGFLKNIIGTKQDRDLKQYQSLVLEINKNFESFQSLSGDELRSKTLEFRERISDYLSEIDAEIASVTEKAVSSEDFNEKDELFKEVDELPQESRQGAGRCAQADSSRSFRRGERGRAPLRHRMKLLR